MSTRWCGMPRRSAGAILSVPMSNPRYTAVESQLMISPPNRSAMASASALLPVAVGPSTATAFDVTLRSREKQPPRTQRPQNSLSHSAPGRHRANASTRCLLLLRTLRLLSRHAGKDVEDEGAGKDEESELLRARHRGG